MATYEQKLPNSMMVLTQPQLGHFQSNLIFPSK